MNNTFAVRTRYVVIPRTEGRPAFAAIEMATGGEGNVDPLKCDLVAPLGAAGVGATQRVPAQSWAIHSESWENNLKIALVIQ